MILTYKTKFRFIAATATTATTTTTTTAEDGESNCIQRMSCRFSLNGSFETLRDFFFRLLKLKIQFRRCTVKYAKQKSVYLPMNFQWNHLNAYWAYPKKVWVIDLADKAWNDKCKMKGKSVWCVLWSEMRLFGPKHQPAAPASHHPCRTKFHFFVIQIRPTTLSPNK